MSLGITYHIKSDYCFSPLLGTKNSAELTVDGPTEQKLDVIARADLTEVAVTVPKSLTYGGNTVCRVNIYFEGETSGYSGFLRYTHPNFPEGVNDSYQLLGGQLSFYELFTQRIMETSPSPAVRLFASQVAQTTFTLTMNPMNGRAMIMYNPVLNHINFKVALAYEPTVEEIVGSYDNPVDFEYNQNSRYKRFLQLFGFNHLRDSLDNNVGHVMTFDGINFEYTASDPVSENPYKELFFLNNILSRSHHSLFVTSNKNRSGFGIPDNSFFTLNIGNANRGQNVFHRLVTDDGYSRFIFTPGVNFNQIGTILVTDSFGDTLNMTSIYDSCDIIFKTYP